MRGRLGGRWGGGCAKACVPKAGLGGGSANRSVPDPSASPAVLPPSPVDFCTSAGPDAAAVFCSHYYVKPEGNCDLSPRSDPHGEFAGLNCLIARQVSTLHCTRTSCDTCCPPQA